MLELLNADFWSILAAGFFVGIVVGLTGMGGGALMTPALIFLGVGNTATVIAADLTAAAVYKTGGALVHRRHGNPNMELAKWLMLGSIPMAFIGPFAVHAVYGGDPETLEKALKTALGFALLIAAATYAMRLYIGMRQIRRGTQGDMGEPTIRPIPT